MKKTVSLWVSGCCNLRCCYCVAEIPRNQDFETQFDFEAARAWLDTYRKKCNVHIGGGEPLMIEGLATNVQNLLDDGHDVTIFTNTTLLANHTDLHTMPVNWQCSHHFEQGISYDEFFENIAPLPKERVLVVRLLWGHDAERNTKTAEKRYTDTGYNFLWQKFKGGYAGYENKNDFGKNPSKHFIAINLHGQVVHCSNERWGIIGDIHENAFDEPKTENMECWRHNVNTDCQACQAADIFTELHKSLKKDIK